MFTRFLNKMKTLIIIVATLIIVFIVCLSPCACCGALSVRQSLKTHLKSNDQTTSLHTPERAIECQRLRHAWLTPYTHRERYIYFRFFYMVILDLFRFTGGRQIKTNTFSAEPIKVNITSHINMYVCIQTYIRMYVNTSLPHIHIYIHTDVKLSSRQWPVGGLISKFRTSAFSSQKKIRISLFFY